MRYSKQEIISVQGEGSTITLPNSLEHLGIEIHVYPNNKKVVQIDGSPFKIGKWNRFEVVGETGALDIKTITIPQGMYASVSYQYQVDE